MEGVNKLKINGYKMFKDNYVEDVQVQPRTFIECLKTLIFGQSF